MCTQIIFEGKSDACTPGATSKGSRVLNRTPEALANRKEWDDGGHDVFYTESHWWVRQGRGTGMQSVCNQNELTGIHSPLIIGMS